MPLPAALVPLGAALKGLTGIGGAVKLGAKGGMAYAKGRFAKRMAGDALKGTGKFFLDNAGANTGERLMRIGPDVLFGGMAAVQTPGDLGDKLIAGSTQALGGALGGIGAAGLAKKMKVGPGGQLMADMGGSYAGDFIGMAAGDSLMRAKGGGLTPWERLNAEHDAERQRQLEQELRMVYGLGGDPFLADNGLA